MSIGSAAATVTPPPSDDLGLKVYACDHGVIIVDADNVHVKIYSTVKVKIGANPNNTLAKCECFGLYGQGTSASEAIHSLTSVLRNYLTYYHSEGQLASILHPKIWRMLDLSKYAHPFAALDDLFQKGIVVAAGTSAD